MRAYNSRAILIPMTRTPSSEDLWSSWQRVVGLLLAGVLGIAILYSSVHFQPIMAQGDHGRDLYAFQQASLGAVPYRDYWWVYGPLMPEYYGLFLKILGTQIPSILLGKVLLTLLSGILIYLILSLWISPAVSLAGALWFWCYNPEFFFTYNHAGGITALLAILYAVFLYIKSGRIRFLYFALGWVLILSLIKINIGLVALGILVGGTYITDKVIRFPLSKGKKIFYLLALTIAPLFIAGVYAFLTRGLSIYEIRQCFPYLRTDHPYNVTIMQAWKIYAEALVQNISYNWASFALALLIVFSTAQGLMLLLQKRIAEETRHQLWLAAGILIAFCFFNLHEFLASGVFYRTYWSKPFQIILIFLIIGVATQSLGKTTRILLCGVLFWISGSQIVMQERAIRAGKTPQQYLSLERSHVYLGNSPEWIETVSRTTDFLKKNLGKDETFFALPNDPIYYYLAGKTSPTRQLIFFDHINIPPEQEEEIIAELENHSVNYIVLSSRISSPEQGLGTFGVTYCPILARYINDHFEIIASLGDWTNTPLWAWNHGTKVLKRK